jgi:hypothetical protein
MIRDVLSVVVGAVVWMVVFFALASGLARVWPDFALHARQWTHENVFTFTSAMACCNLMLWLIADLVGGWLAGKIARRREAVWVLAGLIGLYLAALHLVLYWSHFPWWYNLGVVIPAVPAVLFGGRLARRASLAPAVSG